MGVFDLLEHAVATFSYRSAGGEDDQSGVELQYRFLRQQMGVPVDFLPSTAALRASSGRAVGPIGSGLSGDQRWALLGLAMMLRSLIRLEGDPFASLLEAPTPIVNLYQAHASSIRDTLDAHRCALLAAGRYALEDAFPHLRGRSVTLEELVEHGYPRPQRIRIDDDDW
jgi:hypothetical protein